MLKERIQDAFTDPEYRCEDVKAILREWERIRRLREGK